MRDPDDADDAQPNAGPEGPTDRAASADLHAVENLPAHALDAHQDIGRSDDPSGAYGKPQDRGIALGLPAHSDKVLEEINDCLHKRSRLHAVVLRDL